MYKLVLKERSLREEKIGDKFYLYHATVTGPDLSILRSFRQGVRANASKGMAATQGAGFYLFQDKKSAVDRLYSSMLVNVNGAYNPFNEPSDGYRLLVTIELDDLNPAKFNLDNEASYKVIIKYLLQNAEELNKKLPPEKAIRLSQNRKDAIVATSPSGGRKILSVGMEATQYEADTLAPICDALEEHAPEMWHELERKMFGEADAIKYIGSEIINPAKLEVYDEDRKVIDVTTKDP